MELMTEFLQIMAFHIFYSSTNNYKNFFLYCIHYDLCIFPKIYLLLYYVIIIILYIYKVRKIHFFCSTQCTQQKFFYLFV